MTRTFIALACVLAAAGCTSTKKTDYSAGGGDQPKVEQPSSTSGFTIPRTAEPAARDDGVSDSDRRLADDIRRNIDAGDFSSEGKNVLVNVRNGRVTLRGTTASMTERELILRVARQQAGFDNVDNQLEVESRR